MSDHIKALRDVVGNSVSRETFEKLASFEQIFLKWNARINLAAPSTLSHLWERHILDSAQLLRHAAGVRDWADLGSGGGLPGLVVAILLPNARVNLVESNRKKASFLVAAAKELDLKVKVHAVRIDDCWPRVGAVDIVSARALAPLVDLMTLASPALSAPGSRALFHKGREYRLEVATARSKWDFDLVVHPSVIEHDSVVLEITRLQGRV